MAVFYTLYQNNCEGPALNNNAQRTLSLSLRAT